MTSAVGICNRALQKLGAERIVSLSEDSPNARECNVLYGPIRDSELRAHPWNFAVRRVVLAPNAAAPAFGGGNRFTLPPDCLRVLPPPGADWRVEGREVVAYGHRLALRYLRAVPDPEDFEPLFAEALASRLAVELCEALTQSNTKKETAAAQYRQAIAEARRMNAMENPPTTAAASSWTTRRL